MIRDAFGNIVEIGDHVAYAPGGKGAQGFYNGVVVKVTEKGVVISDSNEVDWQGRHRNTVRRSTGCFVKYYSIDSLIGKANAWDKLDKHISDVTGRAEKLRKDISEELHKDNCSSAWVHSAKFIDELVHVYNEE